MLYAGTICHGGLASNQASRLTACSRMECYELTDNACCDQWDLLSGSIRNTSCPTACSDTLDFFNSESLHLRSPLPPLPIPENMSTESLSTHPPGGSSDSQLTYETAHSTEADLDAEPYQNVTETYEHGRRDDEEKAWTECAKKLMEHDKAIAQAWKEEIDALLVFAGLFSAALTAFNVELYTALRPDPGVDLTNQILLQISAQLNGSSQPSTPISLQTADPPSSSSVYINALWFSALALSLSAASIAIIVRQWLNHFVSRTDSDNRRAAQIHCLRYKFGLTRWRVEEILSTLPILLLLSLVLFFIGLLILLWSLNNVVAAITSMIVSALFIFFIFTTVAPALRHDCAYKSPQALLTLWLVSGIWGLAIRFGHLLSPMWERTRHTYLNIIYRSSARPQRPRNRIRRFLDTAEARQSAKDHIRMEAYDSWRALELAVLHETASVNKQLRCSVIGNVLCCADATLSDDSLLINVIHPCASDPSLYSQDDVRAVIKVLIETAQSADYYPGRCIPILLRSFFCRVATSRERYEEQSSDLRILAKLDISRHVWLHADARGIFMLMANLYPSCPEADRGTLVSFLSRLVPKLDGPFVGECPAFDDMSLCNLLSRTSWPSLLAHDRAQHFINSIHARTVVLIILASAWESHRRVVRERDRWDEHFEAAAKAFFEDLDVLVNQCQRFRQNHDINVIEQRFKDILSAFQILTETTDFVRPRFIDLLGDSLPHAIDHPFRRFLGAIPDYHRSI